MLPAALGTSAIDPRGVQSTYDSSPYISNQQGHSCILGNNLTAAESLGGDLLLLYLLVYNRLEP